MFDRSLQGEAGGYTPGSTPNGLGGMGSMFGGGLGGLAGHLGQLFGGLFNDSGKPYQDAMDQYQKYANQGIGVQNPFMNMGTGAIPQFQDWLKGMQDPSGFINNLMGKYQESPFAKYQQQQGMRAAQNMGSASGLTGSTPLTQFAQQNAQNISSQDMNQWLQNVLGVNTQYGGGLQNEITGGQNAANQMTNSYNQMANNMGGLAYGKQAGRNADQGNLWGGLFGTAGDIAGSLFGS